MSVQATCKTVINDEASLVDALSDMYGKKAITVVKEGVKVSGYISDKKPSVLINLPGMYGTAGFVRTKDGSYELVYDSTDRNRLKDCIPYKKGKKEFNRLAQVYAKNRVLASMKSLRGKVVKDELDAEGTIRIKIRMS